MQFTKLISLLLIVPLGLVVGCGQKEPKATAAAKSPPKHEHKPPHGGTPVVLGDEIYHAELVRDAATGKLQAFVFDGELENFIRSSVPSIEIDAVVNGEPKTIVLSAVANPATGETLGDTSLFEGQADWLKSAKEFDATLQTITVRGTTFADVKFNFPKGNDKD
ncbi:MAG: hypothetical protein JWQ62_3136 [Lacunisphaera sp.]|nr:hypothetical protein [Lacunisphaera sp.]